MAIAIDSYRRSERARKTNPNMPKHEPLCASICLVRQRSSMDSPLMFRTILAPLWGNAQDDTILSAAFSIGGSTVHVEALYVRPDPRESLPMFGEGVSASLINDLIEATDAEGRSQLGNAKTNLQRIGRAHGAQEIPHPHASSTGRSWRLLDRTGRPEEVITHSARVVDISIFSQTSVRQGGLVEIAFEETLLGSGRPVLLVPDQPVTYGAGETVAIAWNGGREAAQALAAAMPLLQQARRRVILTTADKDNGAKMASGVVDYLAWYGLAASVVSVTPSSASLGQALMEEAQRQEARLLVMGGYGHSRMREMVLGGVTRWVVAHPSITTFMAH